MAKLTVPEKQIPVIREFMQYSKEKQKNFIEAIQKLTPTCSMEKFVQDLASQLKIPERNSQDILEVLMSLYVSSDIFNDPLEVFISSVCESLKDKDDKELTPSDNDWDRFKQFLHTILSQQNTLGIFSKAQELLMEYPHTYCSARIITDIRPIFGPDVTTGPKANIIVHQLRITFHETISNHEHREFYISLKAEDIEDLKRLFDRAQSKEKSIKEVDVGGKVYVS
jgi:hypothetical protein